MEVLEKIPKTALDVFRLLPEGTLCEVLNNTLYMSPAPRIPHQQLVLSLVTKLNDYVEKNNLGIALVSPVDVYFEPFLSAVQPDVLFISTANMSIIHEDGYIYGAPDLIVEVLSEDVKRDTVVKKELYERAGVKEYFIVDPADRKVTCFTFVEGKFILNYEATGIFKSTILGFEFSF